MPAEGTQANRLVTVDDERDVEPPLQRGGTVPQQHRIQPGILLTNILNLQSVVKVHPHPFHLELWPLVYQLSVFIPGHDTHAEHSCYSTGYPPAEVLCP